MNPMTLFAANVVGNEKNTRYPHKRVITNSEELKAAVAYDHVTATYQANTRSASGFVGSDCVVMDIDNDHTTDPTQWITPEGLAEVFPLLAYYTATSRNHMVDKGMVTARPRFHVYFPIQPCSRAEDYVALKKTLAAQYPFFDANALDAARFIYGNPDAEVVVHEGNLLVDDVFTSDTFAAFDQETQQIQEGSRNATMSRFAGRVLIRLGNTPQARAAFEEKAALCNPPLETGELESIWNSALRFASRVEAQPGYLSPEAFGQLTSLKPDDLTDVGQAEVLTAEYQGRLRHSPATDWLVYKDGWWQENAPGAHALAQDLTKRQLIEAMLMFDQARQHLTDTGVSSLLAAMSKNKALSMFTSEQRRAWDAFTEAETYMKYVLKRRESRAITACMKETQPFLQVTPSELDAHPHLLNTPSATYDLTTGEAREHDAADLLTKQTSLDPSNEGAGLWEEALAVFFQGDTELMGYVQRIVGLAAFGKVMVEALIIAYGDGRNGKSTFWNVIARVLGSYSGNLSADVLTVGARRNVKPELAEAKGKRLLIAAEMEEGMRLNTANVKQLASTDEIYAEKKYKDPFAYTPIHTLVLYTNHLPRVGAMDTGIWRRLIVIPFEAKIEGGADVKNYADHLYAHAGGAILAWIMQGASLIHNEGYRLVPPAKVQAAIGAYRESNDWFTRFVEECCDIDPRLTQPSGALYQEYRAWCARTGEWPRSTSDFYAAIDQSDSFQRRRSQSQRFVLGLALKSEFES